mgnify:CR=1 FL=1
MPDLKLKRGDIWLADLNPVRGHEQAGKRPVLIISDNTFNSGPAALVIILPVTSTDRNIPAHIKIFPPEGGLKNNSVILCDAIRSVSKDRLISYLGKVEDKTISEIEKVLRILLVL